MYPALQTKLAQLYFYLNFDDEFIDTSDCEDSVNNDPMSILVDLYIALVHEKSQSQNLEQAINRVRSSKITFVSFVKVCYNLGNVDGTVKEYINLADKEPKSMNSDLLFPLAKITGNGFVFEIPEVKDAFRKWYMETSSDSLEGFKVFALFYMNLTKCMVDTFVDECDLTIFSEDPENLNHTDLYLMHSRDMYELVKKRQELVTRDMEPVLAINILKIYLGKVDVYEMEELT